MRIDICPRYPPPNSPCTFPTSSVSAQYNLSPLDFVLEPLSSSYRDRSIGYLEWRRESRLWFPQRQLVHSCSRRAWIGHAVGRLRRCSTCSIFYCGTRVSPNIPFPLEMLDARSISMNFWRLRDPQDRQKVIDIDLAFGSAKRRKYHREIIGEPTCGAEPSELEQFVDFRDPRWNCAFANATC